jgi:XTP/dITP diphosphohydrolase
VPQSEFQIPSIEEIGESFVENAIIKARHAARLSGLAAIADDSGLMVDALDGAPGIYSARYARVGASDGENLQHLLDSLHDVPESRDPVFYLEDCGCTSAELAPARKNSISHRARAMRALLARLAES